MTFRCGTATGNNSDVGVFACVHRFRCASSCKSAPTARTRESAAPNTVHPVRINPGTCLKSFLTTLLICGSVTERLKSATPRNRVCENNVAFHVADGKKRVVCKNDMTLPGASMYPQLAPMKCFAVEAGTACKHARRMREGTAALPDVASFRVRLCRRYRNITSRTL